ncbi:insoluble domain protein [Rhodococcus sp. NPDC058505]|uniref:insoluble domain protein n=1 Tax=unclassified Rhodococcus (in: high G+C Gram-positive bacteria) TaxID=192944 RepID=UPI0036566713
MSRTTSQGPHRRRAERVVVAGALPVAIAIACAGVAVAVPVQPGVSDTPDAQPGVDAELAPPVVETPPAAAPVPEESKMYWVAPPVEYDNVPTRPAPTRYYEEEPIAPARVQQLHLPVPVAPVAPIEAPAERLRLGDYIADRPNWLTEANLDRTNNTAAAFEAQVNTFWQSVGLDASRADRIGAATVGGAAVAGLGAAAAAGLPAAVAGGLVGGAIGGNIGVPAGAIPGQVVLPVIGPVAGAVVGGAVGTAAGAAIGAAAVGVPVAVVAGTAGALVGGVTGAAFGAGDTLAEPIEMEIPDAPTTDPAAVTQATRDTVTRVESLPGGDAAVAAVRDAVEVVPPQVAAAGAGTRAAALGLPGGPDLVRRVEAAGTAAAAAAAPVSGPVGEVLGAVAAGLR